MVKPPHQRTKRIGVACEIQPSTGGRALVAAIPAPRCRICRAARRGARFQQDQQLAEAFGPGSHAAGVERERGFPLRDIEVALQHDVAGIEPGLHQVPGHGVPTFPLDQRPYRGVQSGILRQWTVVKVDCPDPRLRDHLGRNQGAVGDAQQPVEMQLRQLRGQIGSRRDHGQSPLDRPALDFAGPGDDRRDRMSARMQGVAALREQDLIAHHDGG